MTLTSPAKAILDKNLQGLDPELMAVPQEINPDLNKQVNFSFKDTNISDILLLLSKVGNFNVILPNQYDQKISITLTKQKVILAIDDIAKLAKLNYEFRGNSLIFSSADFKDLSFVSLPLSFYSADEMARAINNTLFREIEISSPAQATKPHAAVDPGKNSIIVVGTEEQIDIAKKFITKLDVADKVEIYTPSFLNLEEIRELIKKNLSKENLLKIRRLDNNSVLIKGNEKEVKDALSIITANDLPQDPVDLMLEVYALKPNSYEAFVLVNNSIKVGEAIKINPNIYELGKAPDIFKFLEKVDHRNISLKKDELVDIYALKLSEKRDILDKSNIIVNFNEQGSFRLEDSSAIFYLLDKELLKTNRELKKFSNLSQPDLVLVKLSKL